ncbi:MAG: DUF3658 domain-containing protein [Pseudomonadota bacterium]
MAAPVLHVVFSEAGADVLRAALVLAGRAERVLPIADDLAVGPLDRPPEPAWAAALAPGSRPRIWTDRRVARQYAGLMAFAARAGDIPFEIIDLTHVDLMPLDDLAPAAVVPFLDDARAAPARVRADLAEDWSRLVSENAPLRMIVAGELVSRPIDTFDEAIVGQCSTYWMRRALVIDMVLGEVRRRRVWNLAKPLLEARIDALVAEGRLLAGEGHRSRPQPELRVADENSSI